MPSRSDKQRRFMQIAAQDEEFAAKNNISQKVAKEFHAADKKLEEVKKKGKDK